MMGIMPVLAAVVDITGGEDGGHVVIDPTGPMQFAALYLFLILLPFVLVLLFFFYKKKLQHQQILVAMEKGLPISDLIEKPRNKEVNWVRSLSAGIGFIFTGLALAGFFVWTNVAPGFSSVDSPFLILPIVIFGLGLIFLFRGILQKNYEKQKQKENSEPPQ